MVCKLARCQRCSIGRGDPESFVSEHQKETMTQRYGSHFCIPGVKILRKDKRSSPLSSNLTLTNKMACLIFKHRSFTLKCSNPTVHRSQRYSGEEVAQGVKFYRSEQHFELWPEHTSNFESNGSRPQMLVKGLVFQNPFLRRVLRTNRIDMKPTRFGD